MKLKVGGAGGRQLSSDNSWLIKKWARGGAWMELKLPSYDIMI